MDWQRIGQQQSAYGRRRHPADHTTSASELQRFHQRRGPLFVSNLQLDTSRRLADGRLIRSDRMARLEAVLMISRGGVSARKLRDPAGLIDTDEVECLIATLNDSYDAAQSAFRIESTATGYALMTRTALVSWLDRLHQRQSQLKLSQPSMETLTIIAYQQPITRVGVEAIRGVQSSEMIRQLIDRGLVKVGGEEDSLGRPFLYVTTKSFLDMFGISRIRDLPDYDTIGRQPDPPRLANLPDEESEADQTDDRTGQQMAADGDHEGTFTNAATSAEVADGGNAVEADSRLADPHSEPTDDPQAA